MARRIAVSELLSEGLSLAEVEPTAKQEKEEVKPPWSSRLEPFVPRTKRIDPQTKRIDPA